MFCAGVYRIVSGAEIVHATFDTTTQMIGPYHVPLNLVLNPSLNMVQATPMARMYEVLLSDENAVAAFEIDAYCICVVTYKYVYQVLIDKNGDDPNLRYFKLAVPIKKKNYRHVGYVKTYPKTKAIAVLPYKLFIDEKGFIPGTRINLSSRAVENPELALYKQLIDHPTAYGVYLNKSTMRPSFITK